MTDDENGMLNLGGRFGGMDRIRQRQDQCGGHDDPATGFGNPQNAR
jgi:hypothetical protein